MIATRRSLLSTTRDALKATTAAAAATSSSMRSASGSQRRMSSTTMMKTTTPVLPRHQTRLQQSLRWDAATAKTSLSPQYRAFHASRPSSMFIQTESTPNEDALKFLPGQQVMPNGTAEFLDSRDSMRSPLAKRLFGLDGVKTVFFGPDFVSVTKVGDTAWGSLKPEIYSTLMEHFTAGHPLFTEEGDHGSSDTAILDTDSETVAMIKELLDTRVRPAIQEDGGDLEYRGFGEGTDGMVRIKLKGSCRGCDSSTVTLKSGVERMLKHYIPEVVGVEQILDPEEEVALDEFKKLEKKLGHDRQKEEQRESAMGFST